jgi:hypothetical protein
VREPVVVLPASARAGLRSSGDGPSGGGKGIDLNGGGAPTESEGEIVTEVTEKQEPKGGKTTY